MSLTFVNENKFFVWHDGPDKREIIAVIDTCVAGGWSAIFSKQVQCGWMLRDIADKLDELNGERKP